MMRSWISLWVLLLGPLLSSCGEEMGRREYSYLTVSGIGGINQQERLANSKTELSDARNLWAPNGRLEKRPGFWGIGHYLQSVTYGAPGGFVVLKEDPISTFTATNTLDSLPVGSRWYVGIATVTPQSSFPTGLSIPVTNTNSSEMSFLAEYWNGATWARLYAVEMDGTATPTIVTKHLTNATSRFWFPYPDDFTALTIGSSTLAWVRFTLQKVDPAVTTFDASVLTDSTNINFIRSSNTAKHRYFVPAVFPSTTRFISATAEITGTSSYVTNCATIQGPLNTTESTSFTSSMVPYLEGEPASFAVVPQFGEVYVAYDNTVTVHKATVLTAADAASLATVETGADLVGPGEQYDPAVIPQLGTWPQAKYIAFHRGEMWAANLKDGGATSIRWSAGSQAYRIWPLANIDVVADTDQGPITAIYPYNQNMLVFKSDSIWQMIYTGTGEGTNFLNTYRAEKIVSGVGCVSQSSIQDINGTLIFHAEDGIYSFASGQVRKLSDKIQKTIDTIAPGKRAWSTAVNWKSKSCYLLAVTTAGASTNNLVIVFDYKNQSWWLWNNISAISLFSVEDSADTEHIYFADLGGRIYELGVGRHDYGTFISAYGITQRLGQSTVTRKLRLCEVVATNLTDSMSIEVQTNDAPFTGTTTSTLDFTDSNEAEYSTATYGTSTYTGERDRSDGIGILQAGEWFRVKLGHTSKNSPMVVNSLTCGMLPEGVRK